MPPTHVSVSIVVVNYNAGLLLADCVYAGLEQAAAVVVVDNASSDGSMEALAKRFLSEGRLKMIHSDRNLGFATGCNLGARTTSSSYILFLNPDCVLRPEFFATHGRSSRSKPRSRYGGRVVD